MEPLPQSIEYNGRVYDSWNDLPAEAQDLIRSRMPDTNGDGVPDIFQGGPAPESMTTTTIEVNGTTYDSIDDVPTEFRAHLERALAADLAPGETLTERVDGQPVPLPPQQHAGPAAQQQTLLNGQPIDQPKKPWWRRLFD